MFQENLKGNSKKVLRVGGLRKIKGCFEGVSVGFKVFESEFQGNFKGFKGVSRKFHGCSKKDCRVLQGSFQEVSRMFQKVSRVF